MNGLPGMAFPATGNDFVTKDQVADFLEHYANTMRLPIRCGTRVNRLSRTSGDFAVETKDAALRARSVIVAMADYQKPKIPDFATGLNGGIVQVHSSQYKNRSQLQAGPVLVVGLGNSGADIALDIATAHTTIVAGNESGAIPFSLESWLGRHIGTRLVRFGAVRVLNTSTPIGRRARPKMLNKAAPLVRVRPKDLAQAGVERVGRIAAIDNGKPVTEDGTIVNVANVIWCTGYRPGFEWIDLPVFDGDGKPEHQRGVVPSQPGLYFLGLYFLHALWSETLTGVQPDAAYVTNHLIDHYLNVAPTA